ncbi:MAG: hypothetical protein KatS3mg087_0598 [Patescibacteria group bacterium]|nr:MAG: hypothetical protein KatS3mg087_0598 [Patescibacteria group bacterium]
MFEEDSKIMAKLRSLRREMGTTRYTVCMAHRIFKHNPKAFATYLEDRDLKDLSPETIDEIIASEFEKFQELMGPRKKQE